MVRISKLSMSVLAVIVLATAEKPAVAFETREVGAIACIAALGGFAINGMLHWWKGRQVRPEAIAMTAQNSLGRFEATLHDLQLFCWDAESIVRNKNRHAFKNHYNPLIALRENILDMSGKIKQAIQQCDPSYQKALSKQLLEQDTYYDRLLVTVNELNACADTTKEVLQLDQELTDIHQAIDPLLSDNAELGSNYIIGHALAHDMSVGYCLSTLEKKCKKISVIAGRLHELKARELAEHAAWFAQNVRQRLRLYWENENVIDVLCKERWQKIEDLRTQLSDKERQVRELQQSEQHTQWLLKNAQKEVERLRCDIQHREKYEKELNNLRHEVERLHMSLERSQAEKELLEQQMQSLSDMVPPPYEPSAPLDMSPPPYEPSTPDVSPPPYEPSAPPESLMV